MPIYRHRRLEELIGRKLDDPELRAEHFAPLVASSIEEASDLEFKGDVQDVGDDESVKMPSLVAAIANQGGGVILVGVQEHDGRATEIRGILDTEGDLLALRQRLASRISPVPSYEFHRVPFEQDTDRHVLLISIPPSPDAPHAVQRNGALRYPARDGATRRFLSESEIAERYRQRFRESKGREERLTEIQSAALQLVNEGVWMCCTIVPILPGHSVLSNVGRNEVEEWWFHFRRTLPQSLIHGASLVVRIGQRRYRLIEPNEGEGRRFLFIELHTDGTSTVLQRVAMIEGEDSPTVWEESLLWTQIAAISIGAAHAGRCGTSSDALCRTDVVVRGGEDESVIVRLQANVGLFPGQVVGSSTLRPPSRSISSTVSLNLNEAASQGGLIAASYDVTSDLLSSFGQAEPRQITRTGAVNRAFIERGSCDAIERWAKDRGIEVVENHK